MFLTTWKPNKDFNRTAAELRARKLMTSERAKEVIGSERPSTGVEWLTAAEKKATSKPSVKLMAERHEPDRCGHRHLAMGRQERSILGWGGNQTFFSTFTDTAPYKVHDYVSLSK
ncbi:hypothetical protein [Glutamicibacter sp. NPDC127525]|uniref:hypothetical protein n=1 Tax=unclassified Glutamicibacter TaxID=2627139 RepID=UPI003644D696